MEWSVNAVPSGRHRSAVVGRTGAATGAVSDMPRIAKGLRQDDCAPVWLFRSAGWPRACSSSSLAAPVAPPGGALSGTRALLASRLQATSTSLL